MAVAAARRPSHAQRLYVHALEPDDDLCRRHARDLRRAVKSSFGEGSLCDSPRRAETVLLVPSFNPMFHWYRRHLLNDEVVTEHLERCFVLESSDGPADYLRGCYVSMPQPRFNVRRHRAIGFFYRGDPPGIRELIDRPPALTFSFRGAESHPLRRRLLDELGARTEGCVALTDRWLNYSEAEYTAFWEELANSQFVLCPRGIGTTSIRLQETMQAARVPVIIADDWVPACGPDWPSFSLQVREAEIAEIPRILAEHERDAADMGRVARAEWERYFEPRSAYVPWLLSQLEQLDDDGWTADWEMRRWSSPGFRWSHGFDPLHKAIHVSERAARRLRAKATV